MSLNAPRPDRKSVAWTSWPSAIVGTCRAIACFQVTFEGLPNRFGHDQRSEQEDRLLGVIQVCPGVAGLVQVDQMQCAPPSGRAESERADDPRLLRLFLLMDDAQPAFLAQLDDALGEVFVTDAVAKLPVQEIDGELSQRDSCRCLRWHGEAGAYRRGFP